MCPAIHFWLFERLTGYNVRSVDSFHLVGFIMKKPVAHVAAGFGAALAVPAASAEAAVIDLSFSQGSVAYTANGVGNLAATVTLTGPGFTATFGQFNNSVGQGLNSASVGALSFRYYTQTQATVTTGQTFSIYFTANSTGGYGAVTGTATVAFRTAANQLGWIRLNFGLGLGDDIQYLAAAVETTPGQSIRLGEAAPTEDVPLPATLPLAALGTLALGAAGLRRRRKAA